MLFKNTLLISALLISLSACSNSETPTSTVPSNSPSLPSTPAPQDTGSTATVAAADVTDKRFAQEIKISEPLKAGKASATITIPVNVKNTSNFAWDNAGANPVNLSYNWFDSTGKKVVFDGARTSLEQNLAPQDEAKLNAVVQLPDQPGDYTLALTMVQENVAWFNDAGAPTPKIPVTVTAK